tara:strand:+ start:161 stop:424 length:264 start_codon:yes stop_codon:yes gene_type:complete
MYKIINLLLLIIFFLFIFNVYKYYSSNKNIKNINSNRKNIEKLIEDKISNLPTLQNNTNDVIEFNDSFNEEINNNKKRNFWNLLKSQ